MKKNSLPLTHTKLKARLFKCGILFDTVCLAKAGPGAPYFYLCEQDCFSKN